MVGYMAGESLTYNGNGIVIKTTDGGNTWISKWAGLNMGLEGSCFIDENTGFVAGWPQLANGWSGFGKTTDGGNTWTSPVVISDVYYFTDVVFKDANNGIILGSSVSSPVVYYTSNGGSTWTAASGINSGTPAHACHVSGNKYCLVDLAGHIKMSLDNGHTWTNSYTVPGGLLTGIRFFDENTGMACGDNGVIVKTADGGATWQTQQYGTGIWHDFAWQTQDHIFVCGTPEVVGESVDGGATWQDGFPGSTYQAALYESVFTPNGAGFICGSQGTLLKRNPFCEAGFTANQTSICRDSSVSYTSQSTGTVTSYNWFFFGGTPSTSGEQDPVVAYHSQGSFDVALMVSNQYWSDTLLMTNYITVSETPTPVITANGALLSSNVPSGNQWYREGTVIPGATGQTHLAIQSGRYWDVVTQNGCPSDTSNNILVILEGVGQPDPADLRIIRVPGTSRFRLMAGNVINGPCSLVVISSQGVKISGTGDFELPSPGLMEVDPGHLTPGLYVFLLRYRNGQM